VKKKRTATARSFSVPRNGSLGSGGDEGAGSLILRREGTCRAECGPAAYSAEGKMENHYHGNIVYERRPLRKGVTKGQAMKELVAVGVEDLNVKWGDGGGSRFNSRSDPSGWARRRRRADCHLGKFSTFWGAKQWRPLKT